MMHLNRAVCLDYPEIDVPWFHEKYCQQLAAQGNTIHIFKLVSWHRVFFNYLFRQFIPVQSFVVVEVAAL
jgi:hypothetical protein